MFDSLKVGDKVGIDTGGYNTLYTIRTVARTTATQVILDNDKKYNHNGQELGTKYGDYLVPYERAVEFNNQREEERAFQKKARELSEEMTGILKGRKNSLTQEEKDKIITLVKAL